MSFKELYKSDLFRYGKTGGGGILKGSIIFTENHKHVKTVC